MNASRLFAALAFLAAAAAAPEAEAQFATPRPLDDIEMPAPKVALPPTPVEEPPEVVRRPVDRSGEDVYVPGRNDEATLRRERARQPAAAPAVPGRAWGVEAQLPRADGAGSQAVGSQAIGSQAIGSQAVGSQAVGSQAAGSQAVGSQAVGQPAGSEGVGAKPPAGASPPREREARLVMPPADGDARLIEAWGERQKALDTRSFRTALEIEKRLLGQRDELGYANLFTFATAVALEAEELFESDSTEALRRAVFASQLAPDLPHAHWTVARAAFNDDLLNAGRYLGSSVEALRASVKEPRWQAAIIADLIAALIAALMFAGALTIALVFFRHARFFLHDFRHLFPAGASWLQTTTLALLVLAVPPAMGLGIWATFALLAVATWLHMTRVERVVIGLWLAAVGLLPLLAGQGAQWATFAGTRAERVYLVERGGVSEAGGLESIEEAAARGNPPFQIVFAKGRQARRRGDVKAAVSWLRRAAEMRPSTSEALLELGNALFLFGDLDGARESYQRASERDPSRAEPAYNLGRLFAHRARLVSREDAGGELGKSQEFVRRAIELDAKLGLRAGGEVDYRANQLLAGLPLGSGSLFELAQSEAHPARAAAEVAGWLMPVVPVSMVPLVTFGLVGLLFVLSLLAGALAPSRPCHKCGRPVCRRCDVEVVGTTLCGQCFHVFAAREVIDPPVRAAKELGIRRHQRHREYSVKAAALLLCGAGQVLGGGAGRGALLLFMVGLLGGQLLFPGGLVNPPVGGVPAMLKIVPALLLLVVLHVLAARRVFAGFRSPAPKA